MKRAVIILSLLAAACGGAMAQSDDSVEALLAKTYAAQVHRDSIDESRLVAVYDYSVKTVDADGKAVTDAMLLAVQVGTHCTRSFPYRQYCEDIGELESFCEEELRLRFSDALLLMPSVWTGYPEGQMTVRDYILPNIFEAREEKPSIKWTLLDDTLNLCGYPCKTATGELYGKQWTVRYTEDIPSAAGPWKLCGLPGLIVDATDSKGVHHFALKCAEQVASAIYYEHSAITNRVSAKELRKNKNRVFGNKAYTRNPTYYILDKKRTLQATDMVFGAIDGQQVDISNGMPVLENAHRYQPLELK